MSVVKTTTSRSASNSNRARARGGRGRGNRNRQQFNFANGNTEDLAEGNEGNGNLGPPSRNRGHNHVQRGHGNFNDNRHFRRGNSSNRRPQRPENVVSNDNQPVSSSVSSIPKHAKNPIFVGELMQRFTNLLSPSILDREVPNIQKPQVSPSKGPVNNIHTLDSMKDSSISKSDPCSKNGDGNYYQGGNQNKNVYCGDKRLKNENNKSARHNSSSSTFQYTNEETLSPISAADSNRKLEEDCFSGKRNISHRHLTSVSNNQNPNKCKTSFNIQNENTISTSNAPANNPITKRKTSLEESEEVRKFFELFQQSSGHDILVTKDKDASKPPGRSKFYGNVADRTTPRVRFHLENSKPHKDYSEPNEGNLIDNHTPQNSSLLDVILDKVASFNCSDNSQIQFNPDGQNIDARENLSKNPKRGNLKRTGKPKDGNISPCHSRVGNSFFAELNAFQSRSKDQHSFKTLPPDSSNVVNPGIGSQDRNSDHNGQGSNHFQSSDSFRNTHGIINPQNHLKSTNVPGDTRHSSVDRNPWLFAPDPPRLIERDFAGRTHFNFHQPARDAHERVASRSEAVERLQNEYEVKRAEYEAKQKEKEAKKREQYLAKYKHVDQGHRLNEGYLDEAAGYAPGYNPFETEEEVRERQQEQLKQDALVFQELQQQEEERRKRKEEKKAKERLEKNKYYDAGYRLGGEDGPAPGYNNPFEMKEEVREKQQEQLRHDALAFQELQHQEEERMKRKEEKKAKERLKKNKYYDAGYRLGGGDGPGKMNRSKEAKKNRGLMTTGTKNEQPHSRRGSGEGKPCTSISPELLLEGETEAEAIRRQEEQLIVELLIQQQMDLKALNREYCEEIEEAKESKENCGSSSPEFTVKEITSDEKQTSTTTGQGLPSFAQVNKSPPVSGVKPVSIVVPELKTEKHSESTRTVEERVVNLNSAKYPAVSEQMDTKATKRASVSPQGDQLVTKVSRNSVPQVPVPRQAVVQTSAPEPTKPVSCVLKNRNGAVLVLRPSTDALNRTLASKLEVQDEMDKQGFSIHYKPQDQPTPLYSNNRFDQNINLNSIMPVGTGAIPKVLNLPAAPTTPIAKSPALEKEAPKEEVQVCIDYKAELRAARLRMQQQYEETLKKKQEHGDLP